jgi:hypothetical protein
MTICDFTQSLCHQCHRLAHNLCFHAVIMPSVPSAGPGLWPGLWENSQGPLAGIALQARCQVAVLWSENDDNQYFHAFIMPSESVPSAGPGPGLWADCGKTCEPCSDGALTLRQLNTIHRPNTFQTMEHHWNHPRTLHSVQIHALLRHTFSQSFEIHARARAASAHRLKCCLQSAEGTEDSLLFADKIFSYPKPMQQSPGMQHHMSVLHDSLIALAKLDFDFFSPLLNCSYQPFSFRITLARSRMGRYRNINCEERTSILSTNCLSSTIDGCSIILKTPAAKTGELFDQFKPLLVQLICHRFQKAFLIDPMGC